MNEPSGKTPWHLWVVGIVAVLFNGIGVFDFVMSMTQGAGYLEKAGMTPEQISYYLQMPGWMTIVWAVGVFGALLGSVLVLMRKRLAGPVFIVSLAAFVLSLVHTYVMTNGGDIMGPQGKIASSVIFVLLMFFTGYAWRMSKRGVLH
jgi:ribose/xylose/arabinose/galactoside ABC-type transport system permease subunit